MLYNKSTYLRIILFLIFIIFTSNIHSQTLKVVTSGNYQIHLKGTTNEDPNIPQDFQQVKESASLNRYFNNNIAYNIGLNYRFNQDTTFNIILGFDYGKCQLNNKLEDSEIILGQDINIHSFTPYFGIGKIISPEYRTFLYGTLGIAFKTYEGKGDFNGVNVVNNYKNNTSLRLGAGIDIENINNWPITIGAGIHIDIGSIERDEVYFYYQGEKLGRALPTGDVKLQDNIIALNVYLIYQFNF